MFTLRSLDGQPLSRWCPKRFCKEGGVMVAPLGCVTDPVKGRQNHDPQEQEERPAERNVCGGPDEVGMDGTEGFFGAGGAGGGAAILELEREECLQAGKPERSGLRLGYRSGYSRRGMLTRVGTMV